MLHPQILALKVVPFKGGQVKVRETNLPAQLFFRSLGFRAISVLKDFYQDTTEDAYLMHFVSLAAADLQAVPRRMAG